MDNLLLNQLRDTNIDESHHRVSDYDNGLSDRNIVIQEQNDAGKVADTDQQEIDGSD